MNIARNGDKMSNVENFRDGTRVIVIEDHFGSDLAVELDRLPHVKAAVEGLRVNAARRDELHQK